MRRHLTQFIRQEYGPIWSLCLQINQVQGIRLIDEAMGRIPQPAHRPCPQRTSVVVDPGSIPEQPRREPAGGCIYGIDD